MRYVKILSLAAILACLSACGSTPTPNDADGANYWDSDGNPITFSGTVGKGYETSTAEVSETEITDNDDTMVSEGFFMPCTNECYMLISDTIGEVEISPQNKDLGIFNDLTIGDRIKITHSPILETYPGRTTVYSTEKLSDGSLEDIPAYKVSYLEELGWKAISAVPDHQLVEIVPQCTPSMGFSFALPDGWSYTGAFTDDIPTSCTAVYLKPDDTTLEGTIAIEYSKGFAVCGTGLVQTSIDFNGHKATQGFYDGKAVWDFISLSGQYDDCVILNSAQWYAEYEDTIDFILSTVEFKYYE